MNKSEAAWSSDRQNGFENQEEEDQGEARRRRRRSPGDDGAENCCGGFQGGQRRRCRQDLNRGFPAWGIEEGISFLYGPTQKLTTKLVNVPPPICSDRVGDCLQIKRVTFAGEVSDVGDTSETGDSSGRPQLALPSTADREGTLNRCLLSCSHFHICGECEPNNP